MKVRVWGEIVERRAPGIALVFGYSLLAADKGILDKKRDDDCRALAALAGTRNRGAILHSSDFSSLTLVLLNLFT